MLSAEVEENFEIFAWLLTNINLKRQMDTEWTCYIIRKALNLIGSGFLNGGGGGIRFCSLACNGNSAFYFKTLFFVKMLQPQLARATHQKDVFKPSLTQNKNELD